MFSCESCEFLRTSFLQKTFERLLLWLLPMYTQLVKCAAGNIEFAKLRAIRAYVPTCLTCLCALRAYVPLFFTCLRAFIFHVPTCLRTYIYISHAYVPSCLILFCAYVRSFFTCLRAYNHSQNILRLTSLPYTAVFLWIVWPFIPFKTPKQTPASKTAYLNPISWGFVVSTGACTETRISGLLKKLPKTMGSF